MYLFDTNDAPLNELTNEGPTKFKMLVFALEITVLCDGFGSSIILKDGGES